MLNSNASERRETLPFRIRIVRNEDQLSKAVVIRSEAYKRHWPNLSDELQTAETQDRNPNSIVFLAEHKNNSNPLGTLRIDTNLVSALPIMRDVQLPPSISSHPFAYVTRLGVKQGALGPLVKIALFKSLHRYCLAKQLSWILVGVRPPNDKDYVRLGFHDVLPNAGLLPITSSGGIPVRVMALETVSAERHWFESKNPLYDFMVKRFHPEIEIFSSVNGMWSQPRRENAKSTTSNSLGEAFGIPIL